MDGFLKLGLDFKALLVYIINFGFLVLILAKFLYKPTLKFLEEREANIANNLKEAELIKLRFEEVMAKKEKDNELAFQKFQQDLLLAKNNAEAQALTIRQQAEQSRKELLEKTAKEVQELKVQLEGQLEEELLSRINKIVSFALKSNLPAETVLQNIKIAWKSERAK